MMKFQFDSMSFFMLMLEYMNVDAYHTIPNILMAVI